MTSDPTAVVRSLFEAFNEGDLDRAAATVTDDFELVDVAAGQTFNGLDGCREWLGTFRTAFPDVQTEILNLFADGERVASEHIGRGTHNGPFVTPAGTIPATGRRIEVRIGEIYEVRGGKLVKLYAYYDSATVMRQLGLLPASGGVVERAMAALMGVGVRARRVVRR
jgi:steroid delta-isomerase-like uncharacterized protein